MATIAFTRNTNISTDALRKGALPLRIKDLLNEIVDEFIIYRSIEDATPETALISKARFDALVAGATTPAPEYTMTVRTDDFAIPNIDDMHDLVLGRVQGPTNRQVEIEGTGAKKITESVVVPATPFEIDLAKRILIADSDGAAGGIVSYNTATGVVTFDAAEEGNTVNLTHTYQDYAVFGITRTINEVEVQAVLLSYEHYSTLLALNP